MTLEAVMSTETNPKRCFFCNQAGHSMLKCRLNAMECSLVVFDTKRCVRCLEKFTGLLTAWPGCVGSAALTITHPSVTSYSLLVDRGS